MRRSVVEKALHHPVLALVIIVVGFIRATVAAKGFWAKIATFLVVGPLLIVPTVDAVISGE